MDNSEQQELIQMAREAVRGVTVKYDRAYYLQRAREHGHIQDMWEAMGVQGLFGLGAPEEYGGSGTGVTAQIAAMEMLAEEGVPPSLYTTQALTRTLILAHGTEEQKQRFVPPVVAGEKKFAFAMTEPTAGTNTFGMATKAVKVDDDTYRIRGQKTFITGIDEAELLMIVAQTTDENGDSGLSIFVLDLPATGISWDPMEMLTFAPGRQFMVYFDDVLVPAANRIGAEGAGKKVLFHALNPERFMTSAQAIGLANLALAKGADYAKVRAPFGTPTGAYQAVSHPLAKAKAHVEAARLMLYTACADYEAGLNDGVRANLAKYLASSAADDAIDAVIQTYGGSAFDIESDIVTLWPKIRLARIAPLNNEMALNFIAEKTLGLPRSY